MTTTSRQVQEERVDPDVARLRLEELVTELDRAIATLEAENGRPVARVGREIDTADPGAALSDADREGAVIDALRQQRARLNDALARLDAGRYGKRVTCGASLP